MSTSGFQTIIEEIQRTNAKIKLSRSSSVGADMKPSLLNPLVSSGHTRRALYGTLPFMAAFGMQHRETEIRRVLSNTSLQAMSDAGSGAGAGAGAGPTGSGGERQLLLDAIDVDEIIITFPLVMSSFVAIISQFLIGFHTGAMNGPAKVVFPGHTTWEWSLAVSAFAVGGPFGALAGGFLANRRGRRGAMMINTWVFLLGGLLLACAPSVHWLVPARLAVGFASGLASVVVPVYLGEIAPPTLRGTLGTLTQFAMVIGILATDLLAFPLATPAGWRWLFAVTPGLCVLQLLVSPLLLESPRWLLGRDPHSPEARAAIKRIRGFRFDDEVEEEAQHYLYAAQKHKTSRDSAHAAGAMYDLLFRQVDLRPLVVSSIVLQMAQQLSGINAVFYYSTDFFEGVVEKPLLGTTLCASVNVVATYVALKLMDGTPRRTLILWSTGGMVVSTVVITLALTGVVVRSLALAGVLAFVSCFEIGLGPIPWLIVAEMFDAKYVATAMSIACVVNWASNFVVGLSFPFVAHALGAWTWAPFGAIVAATFCFTLWYLPETHGRSVEEINRLVSRYGPDEEESQRQAIHIIQAVEPLDLPPVGKD